MEEDIKILKFDDQRVNKFYKTYLKEVQRQRIKPSMKAYANQMNVYQRSDTFIQAFSRFYQQRYLDVIEGDRKTLGNYMRDFVNQSKFEVTQKQAQALLKGIKNIDETSGEFGMQLDDDILDLSKRLQKVTKGKSYGEQVNLIRTDMYNIMNEDVGMISTVNDTLKELGTNAEAQLSNLMDENPLLDENDPRVKQLKELAKFSNSYNRAEYIGNRIFGS